jgi:hypothetical protein
MSKPMIYEGNVVNKEGDLNSTHFHFLGFGDMRKEVTSQRLGCIIDEGRLPRAHMVAV